MTPSTKTKQNQKIYHILSASTPSHQIQNYLLAGKSTDGEIADLFNQHFSSLNTGETTYIQPDYDGLNKFIKNNKPQDVSLKFSTIGKKFVIDQMKKCQRIKELVSNQSVLSYLKHHHLSQQIHQSKLSTPLSTLEYIQLCLKWPRIALFTKRY